MLQSDEKKKIKQYIQKIINDIYKEAKGCLESQVSNKQIVDRIITLTVNKLTPESKMVMSSAYNMMVEHTLESSLFQTTESKVAFYEMNILGELNSKFNFDVPRNISYEDSGKEMNKLIKAGVVVPIGGIISVSMKSWFPVGIACLLAGIMALVLKKTDNNNKKEFIPVMEEYLHNVEKSMFQWIDSIEQYYDKRIVDLESELKQ